MEATELEEMRKFMAKFSNFDSKKKFGILLKWQQDDGFDIGALEEQDELYNLLVLNDNLNVSTRVG